MKGISPFIATVLLVAVAITVAGIFSGWFTNFIKSMTSMISEREGTRVECTYGGISLSDLEYNSTSKDLSGYIENIDIIPLGNIDLEVFYDNATKEKKDLNKVLGPGEKDVFNATINSNYEKVRVITNCSNVYDELSNVYISEV